jgi:hypothetical protein
VDAIEPILPNPSILPEVGAAQRSGPIHRDDAHQRGDGYGQQRRRRNEEEAVEVDVDGVEDSEEADAEGSVPVLEVPAPRLVDVTADGDPEPPAPRRIDVTDDDDGDPPAHRIDLNV